MESHIPLRTRGDLGQTPAVRLLWDLAARRFSGTLIVRAPQTAGALHGESLFAFRDGRLAQAQLPQALSSLGVVLMQAGIITRHQLYDSLACMAENEGLQGAILVSRGACDRHAIEEGMRMQLRQKALRFFALTHAPFEAHEHIDLLEDFGGKRFPIDVAPLLWEGVRTNPDHPAVTTTLDRLGARSVRTVPDASAMTLFGDGPHERALIERLQHPAQLSELMELGVPATTVHTFVTLLAMTRQLEIASSARSLPPANHDAPAVEVSPVAPPPPVAELAPPPPPLVAAASVLPLRLPSTPPTIADPEIERSDARREALRHGEQYLRLLRFSDAETTARALLLLDPNDVDALVLLAHTLLEVPSTASLDEVKRCVSLALKLAPESDRAFTVAGWMFQRTGDERRAFVCFSKAYKLNPRNVDAAREIRISNLRTRQEHAPHAASGFLARFFHARA